MQADRSAVFIAAMLDTIRDLSPALTNQTIAWAIDQFSDAELRSYPEFQDADIRALRRWAATWRRVEPRL